MYEMHFYVYRCTDGKLHVQNTLMGKFGQHHAHTPEDFEKWREDISDKFIHFMNEEFDQKCTFDNCKEGK